MSDIAKIVLALKTYQKLKGNPVLNVNLSVFYRIASF